MKPNITRSRSIGSHCDEPPGWTRLMQHIHLQSSDDNFFCILHVNVRSRHQSITNTLYLALTSTLWGVYYDNIQRECHSVSAKLHPITFYRIISGECAFPWLNATLCFLWFTNCVLLFDKSLILGCLWPLVFVLNNILILGIWCSTIPHLPGCFCPWTFYENIWFNMVLTDPFISHLATQLGYSAGEFQALQLIVLAAFGVVD